MFKLCLFVLLSIVSVSAEEDETFTIMLNSKDYLAHHPEHGLLTHDQMDENIPYLLQVDEGTVMKNVVPEHCERPNVHFNHHHAEIQNEQVPETTTNFLQVQSALRPAIPMYPTQPMYPAKPMDMSTLLPLAAGAYFLMNGGASQLTNMFQASGIGSKEVMQALPILLALGGSVGGGQGGGMNLGSLAQFAPLVAPMLMGGGGGGQGGGMSQLMQMAPQLMQMAGGMAGASGNSGMGGAGGMGALSSLLGGMGGNGGGMGGMGGMGGGGGMDGAGGMGALASALGGMGGAGGAGGMGGNAAMAQLLPMLMGGMGGQGGL